MTFIELKKKLSIKPILLAMLFISIDCSTNAQSSLNDSLVSINLAYYINKPIDTLLVNLPSSYDSLKVGPDETMFYGARLIINYRNPIQEHPLGYIITIWPNTHNFIDRKNPQNLPFAEAWPITLLTKENIGQIEIIGPSGNIINNAGD